MRGQGSGNRDQRSGLEGREFAYEIGELRAMGLCRELGPIHRFEDLVAWQKARLLTKAIYVVSATGQFGKDYGLSNQIRRACVSIMSNIAEGHDRRGTKEFDNFLSIAKASASEVRSELYVALDAGYVEENEFAQLKAQVEEVSRVLGGLQKAISARRSRN